MPSSIHIKIITAIAVVLLLGILIAFLATSRSNACNVAYIKLHGNLVTYIPAFESASSTNAFDYSSSTNTTLVDQLDQTASDDVTKSIHKAASDSHIKAIVLEVDSTGGALVGGMEIEATLKNVQKPTVALIRENGESSAYLSATGANIIFASYVSEVGAIGVTDSFTDNSKWDIANGVTFNQLSVGKYKDIFNPDKPMTADERALAMSVLQAGYKHFINVVAANRHMSVAQVTALADGSYMIGEDAMQAGLVDQIGDIDDVRTFLTQKLGTPAVICGIDTN